MCWCVELGDVPGDVSVMTKLCMKQLCDVLKLQECEVLRCMFVVKVSKVLHSQQGKKAADVLCLRSVCVVLCTLRATKVRT